MNQGHFISDSSLSVLVFSEKGKYYIDFKNGEGAVGQGDPEHKPDVTITMNEEVFLKIFNREFLTTQSTPLNQFYPRSLLVLSQCKIHRHMKSRDHLANNCTNIYLIIDQFISC